MIKIERKLSDGSTTIEYRIKHRAATGNRRGIFCTCGEWFAIDPPHEGMEHVDIEKHVKTEHKKLIEEINNDSTNIKIA